jgi:hypothetical protein
MDNDISYFRTAIDACPDKEFEVVDLLYDASMADELVIVEELDVFDRIDDIFEAWKKYGADTVGVIVFEDNVYCVGRNFVADVANEKFGYAESVYINSSNERVRALFVKLKPQRVSAKLWRPRKKLKMGD